MNPAAYSYPIPCVDCGADTYWPVGKTPVGAVRCTSHYEQATADETAWRAKADEAAGRRADSLAQLHRSGRSYGAIAELTGLSRARVQQLVNRGKVETSAGATGNPPHGGEH